jgi:hypothetical protein
MPVLHSCCAGSRPAMTLLVVAPPWTTASSINLRRATTVLPVAIGRPNSPPLRPLTKEPINAPRQHTASAEIPIASDAPPRHASRGFLPWRFAYAGPGVRRATLMGPPSANLHKSGSVGPSAPCLLHPRKRTSLKTAAMSVLCQFQPRVTLPPTQAVVYERFAAGTCR